LGQENKTKNMSDELSAMKGAAAVQKIRYRTEVLTRSYIVSLGGRYSHFVADEFLVCLLSQMVAEKMINVGIDLKAISHVAYMAGCEVFERVLEFWCHAGGNGHHVAQGYADMFKNFDTINEKNEQSY
jgi:hypothetical protein